VVITHDEYEQYFIAIEQKLYFESTDLATAVFFLLGCHYVLNLSYHQKLADLLRFYQEKVAGIASAQGKNGNLKLPLPTSLESQKNIF